ncbi:hypothetical protein GCM10022393_05180 [Aquimarina addita]|uniref:SH3b domain-containing protein n=1 Tax=Aquimarina addita TaxID=870485 RepID=A0ABP7XA11_9FLAO
MITIVANRYHKIYKLIYTCIFLGVISSFNTIAQEGYYVVANSGLIVRDQPSLQGTNIAKLPYGYPINIIEKTNHQLTITDQDKKIHGFWIKIKLTYTGYLIPQEQTTGYIFDGFIEKKNYKHQLALQKINQATFCNLMYRDTQWDTNIKIGDYNKIQDLLKNNILFDEYKMPLSITAFNGAHYKFDIESSDTGFSDGWSFYYPELKVLVLEGGHSSDMVYDIKTGAHHRIGNPEYMITSPNRKYRLNGLFGGQECVSYFFESNNNGKFQYILDIDILNTLCNIQQFLWLSDDTFIISHFIYDDGIENEIFYKGKIKNLY